ncbi:PACE efflux transporter [Marinomonas pollencensis]|uniref:Putative membrane protein n=1 Tax=Marinomonas pollencensis TaxID=491954 RepID=A0A3E0DRN6_9GAMM|nr:PACE efflux transporter [Marinomonas pollencensis]REG84995.1 putative membrane protein [Marinomonas pollencensis]
MSLMSVKERVFHSVLFEGLALLVVVPTSALLMGTEMVTMTGLGIAMSLTAMAWNFFYNIGFDSIFGHQRIKRSLSIRVFHSIGFELGLLLATVPLIMWMLSLTVLPALIFASGLVVFFLLYAIIFNYGYDHIRFHLVEKKALH